jgi:thymidylate synthase
MNIEHDYLRLLKDILENGKEKEDRTGTGTISVFGRQIRHKMNQGFPLLTTKKMYWKGIVTELLWFLRGDTNIKYLVDNDCHIWDGDAYKKYKKEWSKSVPGDDTFKESEYNTSKPYESSNFTKEEFINKIKTDDEFAKKWGELGPIYGKQWRNWTKDKDAGAVEGGVFVEYEQIDQISNLIEQLKTNPDSRRLMVNAWNVGELDQMTLPPCHYGFQVYTRKLSEGERLWICSQRHHIRFGTNDGPTWYNPDNPDRDKLKWMTEEQRQLCDYKNIPTRAISLMWNQRSVDTFLGLPFNIASYGLLLEIIAKEVNMVPDELIGNLGDVHLYKNHIEQAKEQLTREPKRLPTLEIIEREEQNFSMDEMYIDNFQFPNYQSHPSIKAPLSN